MAKPTIYWKLIGHSGIWPEPASLLSSVEAERFASFRFKRRKEAWLLGRQAAKSLVQRLPGFDRLELCEMEIANLAEGAPRLRVGGEEAPLRLSISHRQELALCAAVLDTRAGLGADLERIEPHSQEFIRDYFTQVECGLVEAQPVEQRAAAATLIWSTKEAMLKALEVGLRWDTRRVEVSSFDGILLSRDSRPSWQAMTVRCPDAGPGRWQAWWRPRGEYLLTIAVLTPGQITKRSFVLVEM